MFSEIAPSALTQRIRRIVQELDDELVAFRRDIHQHPEVSWAERRTTAMVAERLRVAGLEPQLLPRSGLICDIRPRAEQSAVPLIALRADLDALPILDRCTAAWSSSVAGISHACGHDLHTAVVLGAGLVLAELQRAGELMHPVRLIFQPAEEVMPGGSLDVIDAGALRGVGEIYAMHCDPTLEVGSLGTRIGPMTSASDAVKVTVSSAGGHTSRPHLTGDVIYALGSIMTMVPAILGRRLDPRSGVNLTWGSVHAGDAPNAIPAQGTVSGTLRCLDRVAWDIAALEFRQAVEHISAPFGVDVTIDHVRGVPPVDNVPGCVARIEQAVTMMQGAQHLALSEQSLGGEDFAWYLTHTPGALVRLGTKSPAGHTYDLHQGDFSVDERALGVGVRVLAQLVSLADSAIPEFS